MKREVAFWCAALLLSIVVLGCEPPRPAANAPPGPGAPAVTTTTASPANNSPPALPPETKFGVFAGDVNDLAAQPRAPQTTQPTAPPPVDPGTERVKAQAGVGIQGQSLAQHEGLVVTPVKAFFSGKQRAFFDIEFPGNYRTWRVQEERAPKDFEELKAKFLDPLGLTKHLPPLPPGHKYVWDGEKEELQVERPRQQ